MNKVSTFVCDESSYHHPKLIDIKEFREKYMILSEMGFFKGRIHLNFGEDIILGRLTTDDLFTDWEKLLYSIRPPYDLKYNIAPFEYPADIHIQKITR